MKKKQIVNAENQLLEAIKISDVTTLDQLLHDDLLFITPDGVTVTKEMDLDAHRSGAMVVEEVKATVESVSLVNDTAVVVVVYETKGKMLGNPIEGKFKYLRIWKLFDDQLKVIGGSCSQL